VRRTLSWSRTDITVGVDPLRVAVTPDGKTAFVANSSGGTISTIDVKTRTKDHTDIPVGGGTTGVAVTPDGKTAFVTHYDSGTVSTIDVKTGTKHPTDITVGANPGGVAVTPDGKTAFVTNFGSGTVSTNRRAWPPVSTHIAAHRRLVALRTDRRLWAPERHPSKRRSVAVAIPVVVWSSRQSSPAHRPTEGRGRRRDAQ
jgi:YVTN family beta-propeller protein